MRSKQCRKSKRVVFVLMLLPLCAAFGLGYAHKHRSFFTIGDATQNRNDVEVRKAESVKATTVNRLRLVEPPQVVTAPFDVPSHVIAGGGGTSSGMTNTGNTLKVDGTIGEVSASNEMSGNGFKVSGGFWNAGGSNSSSTPTPTPTPVGTAVQFTASNLFVAEAGLSATFTVMRTGDTTGSSSVQYTTGDLAANSCSAVQGSASSRCDYITALGTLNFAANETTKNITVLIIDDVYAEANESLDITLSNPVGAVLGPPNRAFLTINDNETVNGTTNPVDGASFFVRQHYLDFLNREPDNGGLAFWTNEITSCGANAQCIEVKRINVSAAFFLSIEFQNTGYLVYRFYKSGFGNLPGAPVPARLLEFLRDTQRIGQGVQVGIGPWEQQLEANKQSFALAFVQRGDFQAAFPTTMTAVQFVDQLDTNAGGVLSPTERNNLITTLANPSDFSQRAAVLKSVAEDQDLRNAEFNKAFVLMQYFGYLRRNPNDPPDSNFGGSQFWLDKLNQFNGNFVNAEMVKAFISSLEYRQRFGP